MTERIKVISRLLSGFDKFTLAEKGVILVAVPLVLQLGFLAGFAGLFTYAEYLFDEEHRQKTVIGQSNWIAAELSIGTLSRTAYVLTGDKSYLDAEQQTRKDAASEWQALAGTAVKSPDQAQRIDKAQKLSARLFEQLDRVAPVSKDATVAMADSHLNIKALRGMLTDLWNWRHDIMHEEVRSFPKPLRAARMELRIFLATFAIIDAAAVFLLGFLYIRHFTSRLNILTENATNLSAGKDLHPLIGGGDELATLDQAFHSMAQALDQSQQMRNELTSMISHDLRTPLTTLMGVIYLLREGELGELTERGHKLILSASVSVDHMNRLANDFLNIDKIESAMLQLEKSSCQAKAIIAESIEAASILASARQVSVESDLRDDKLFVYADQARIVQVLVNLIVNAVKFSPPDCKVVVWAKRCSGGVEFSVSDRGRGIPKDQLHCVFDRYKQVKNSDARIKGGVGLGLAICQALIDLHGGSIAVESEESKGSRFYFMLPDEKTVAAAPDVKAP